MKKKVIATVLILANLLTLASCSQASNSDTPKSRKTAEAFDDDEEAADDEEEKDNGSGKIAEERIYNCIDKLATTLAECDYDGFCELCTYTPYEVRSVMPVVYEVETTDYDDYYIQRQPSEMLRVKNAIAATTTYEIDKSSFKANLWA